MASHLSGTAFRSIRTLFTAGTVGGLTDGELLDRFIARDGDGAELAFASLVERHGPMVLHVCRTVLCDAHLAEDAFQATFVILALKAGSIRGRDSLTSWLHSVAYNVAATARSSAARRRSHELKAGKAKPLAFTENAGDDVRLVIHEELDRIPKRYRTVLTLCCLEGLTQNQAAQRLGWPLGTVQSRLARGRERLRSQLARRGLAPSAAVLMTPLTSEAAQAMPAALANSTVRLALTIGAAPAMATGAVPFTVMRLAKGAIRTMVVSRVLTAGMATLLAAGLIATGAAVYAYQAGKVEPAAAPTGEIAKREEPAAAHPDDGLLTVTGIVRMQDGSPVVGALVRSMTGPREASTVARTDAAGRFQLYAVLGDGGRLHVSSADGSYQAVSRVPAIASRTVFASPLELTLMPALAQRVTVLSQGRPVAGAHVAALGTDFQVEGSTGQDGQVRLRFPANEHLSELVAWHPTLGVSGKQDLADRPRQETTQLSLLPPAPHRIRVTDVDGRPVGGVELAVSVRTENSDWIIAKGIEASHVRTGSDGTATVPWAPRELLKYVDVSLLGTDWKLDDVDQAQIGTRITTVHARRERTVQGRLIMTDGALAQGILVTGFGFGPMNAGQNLGHVPYARAHRDGTFSLRVPAEHGYALGIADLDWATDPWTGMILANDSAKPAEITMPVYPATPLTVRVTRGPGREPVVNAWVELTTLGPLNWAYTRGVKLSGPSRFRTWLTTGADGVARAGVGKGEHELRLSSGDWNEERTVQVTAGQPVEVEFHRSWSGTQRITGRLMFGGMPYAPSPTLVARAWAAQRVSRLLPSALDPVVHADGSFEVAFDAESASLFFVDRIRQRSGFVERIHGGTNVDVTMEPTATYSGILVDDNALPVVGRTLELYAFKLSNRKAVAAEQTDKRGRFRFTGVPSNVPIEFHDREENGRQEANIVKGDRSFKPGEVRENDELKLHEGPPSSPNERTSVSLAKSVENICRNAPSCGMRAVVALLGDDSGDAARTIDQLFDYDDDRTKAILSYLTLRVDAPQLKREDAILTARGWPKPAQGEIVLIVLDGGQKAIAAQRITTGDVGTAVSIGIDFLKEHRPPTRNALTSLAEARSEAKRSGRRVWVIEGGPRCGPCFRLARWVDDHHAILDKDFVIVKLMQGIDEHVTEAISGLPINIGEGIPWFAVTEPDGTVLAISRGPQGNIGFPASAAGIRHLRQVLDQTVKLITALEVDRLIATLSSDK